jgi:hypothetical protein
MKTLRKLHARDVACVLLLLVSCIGPAVAQTAPPLGTAAGFAVLGGSTVTNTGSSVVQGDLGVSPGSAITGFPPGIVVGTTHSADAAAAQAQNDVTAAFTDLGGQAAQTNLTGQDLGGLTLTPGVYDFDNSAGLTGTLTLDAQGDPAAVFIIRTGSTLTTASASSVVLINGASGCNVFWRIGSSATFGTGSSVVGNVLALTSITMTTGASISGRLLARNGAVTLDGNSARVCGSAACAGLAISPGLMPVPTAGQFYSQTFTASGGTGPYTFALASGALPPGLSLSGSGPNTALVSGVPSTAANFTFGLVATDALMCTAVQGYSGIAIFPQQTYAIPATTTPWQLLLAGFLGLAACAAIGYRRR